MLNTNILLKNLLLVVNIVRKIRLVVVIKVEIN